MKTYYWLLAIALFSLAGCAPNTVKGVKDSAAGTVKFHTAQNYQKTYKTILDQARECYSGALLLGGTRVDGDLFSELRRGEVAVAAEGLAGQNVYLVAEVSAAGDGADVTIWHAMSTHRGAAQAMREWVEVGSTACSPAAG